MARELSAVLDHIATIGELDLDDVPPTSHVVEVTGAPARRRAAPVPAARGRARAGAGGRATTASSSRARRHEHERTLLELSAAAAARRDRRRRAVGRGAVRGLPRARGARPGAGDRRPELLHLGRRGGARCGAEGPLERRAAGGQGPVLHRGRAEPVGLAHPRGLPAAVHGDGRRSACSGPARRCWPRPTRTSSRWAPRTRTRPSGRRATPGTATRVPGGSSGGSAAAVAAGPGAVGARHRHRAARSASRRRCAGSSG